MKKRKTKNARAVGAAIALPICVGVWFASQGFCGESAADAAGRAPIPVAGDAVAAVGGYADEANRRDLPAADEADGFGAALADAQEPPPDADTVGAEAADEYSEETNQGAVFAAAQAEGYRARAPDSDGPQVDAETIGAEASGEYADEIDQSAIYDGAAVEVLH